MTLTFEHDLYSVKVDQHKYPVKGHLVQVILRTYRPLRADRVVYMDQ